MSKCFWTLVAASVCMAPSASAYLCSRVPPSGPSLYWVERTVPYSVHQLGCDQIAGDAEFDTIDASFATWSAVDCSDFRFQAQPRSNQTLVGYNWRDHSDNENLIIWRSGRPGDVWRHESASIAVTTTTFNSYTGQMLDADIEFNSANFSFSACDPTSVGCTVEYDIENTLTHEIGHVVGLDHPPASQAGVEETTMYFRADKGETKKRDLAADDIEGFCLIYPSGSPVHLCYEAGAEPSFPTFTEVDPDAPTGCSSLTAGGHRAQLLLLVVYGLVNLVVRLRLHRRHNRIRF